LKQATATSTKTQTMNLNTRQRLLEGFLIVLIAISLYLFLAFLTYHNTDPGWSSTGIGGFVANSGGRVGAWLSDIFFYIFGYIAYLFPIMLLLSALGIFKIHQHVESMTLRHGLLRAFGFFLTLSAACGLASIYLLQFSTDLPLDAGGVLGDLVSHSLVGIFNPVGTSLLLIALLLAGITLFTGLSWLYVVNKTWDGLCCLSRWLYQTFRQWRARVQARKEAQVGQEIQRPIKQRPQKVAMEAEPKIDKKKELRIHEQVKKPILKSKSKRTVTGTMPSLDLLDDPKQTKQTGYSQAYLEQLSQEIEQRLLDFDVEAHVVAVHPGPVITRFELELAPGVKASKVSVLAKDLARSLSQTSVRVVEVIPGKSVIGLEVPNDTRGVVYLKELLQSQQYVDAHSPLSLALGKDISGYPMSADLAKMPHLLVSGTTGAGKSVSLNAMILSILFKAQPDEVRFIMIDPKMLELSVYDGIPHLLTPVVTDMKQAANAFRWCINEMERRYRLMAALGVRNINSFNAKVKQAIKEDKPIPDPLFEAEESGREAPFLEPLPLIVIVVDELADMMLVVGKKVEELIARIAQKARAAGIHMILATQRPSVDVITGLIKANIPTRIAFQVSSRIDSRTILDQQGAEQLLGYGDMLYLPPGTGMPIRIHGAFVSDNEMHRVVSDWKERAEPEYLEAVVQSFEDDMNGDAGENGNGAGGEQDPLYDQAVQIVTESRRASISYVQRRLRIGYNRSANLLEAMEQSGVVSSMESNGSREVLAPPPPSDE